MQVNEKYDIIIQGGQSNAEGSGIGPVSQEFLPNSNIKYLNAKKHVDLVDDGLRIEYVDEPFVIEEANERILQDKIVGDFALTFAEDYVKNGGLEQGRKVLIIRGAIGGTGFYKGHWGLQDKVYLKLLEMVDYALKLNPENRIVTFLWHQGEHDAFEGNPAENYYKQLTDMLKGVRSRYGMMPFIAGDFVSDWKSKNLASCEPIVDVIRRVVAENTRSGFVETLDLLSNNQKTQNGDEIHFCREALHELGHRYFQAFMQLSI